jgi:hypothetical protein
MATRVVAAPEKERKLTRQQAAQQIASLVEAHMAEQGFSEKEKHQRVERFKQRVASGRRAKS